MTPLSSEAERPMFDVELDIALFGHAASKGDTEEAERLFKSVREQLSALLRRIPELEASRLAPSVHEMNYRAAMTALENVKAERDQLRAELEGRWLPIESMPKEGAFLVFTPNERSKVQAARRHGSVFVIGNAFAFDLTKPTHWAPEPPPPTTQEGDK